MLASAPMRRAIAVIVTVLALGAGGGIAALAKPAVETPSSSTSNAAQNQYEKPGCGNEKNIGISGNSGDHGGQPPKEEERGECPHEPGVDGN